jgi:CubicO group peptidase (beta-lactamase class C family)
MPGVQVQTFRNAQSLFATRVVRRGPEVRPLPYADAPLLDLNISSRGGGYDLYDYISRNRTAGLLVLKHGRIAFEHYEFGNDARTCWLSMSLAKSISTTLVGIAIHEGLIGSVDDPLTTYLPELAGSAYTGTSIRHLLQMTSGVQWDDGHIDPRTERREMLELQIAQQPGSILRYIAHRPRTAEPGTVWNYSTGETHVVGALLYAATGRWVSDYLSEKIWSKVGMEADASWWLESPYGLEVAGSGFSATLRDYGRFGLFVLNDGVIDGQRVLPPGWVREGGIPRQVGGKRIDYGYMWWPVAGADGSFADDAFSARGIFGQFIYINPREQVVIAVWSSRSKPKGAEAILDNDFFNAVVAALR